MECDIADVVDWLLLLFVLLCFSLLARGLALRLFFSDTLAFGVTLQLIDLDQLLMYLLIVAWRNKLLKDPEINW